MLYGTVFSVTKIHRYQTIQQSNRHTKASDHSMYIRADSSSTFMLRILGNTHAVVYAVACSGEVTGAIAGENGPDFVAITWVKANGELL